MSRRPRLPLRLKCPARPNESATRADERPFPLPPGEEADCEPLPPPEPIPPPPREFCLPDCDWREVVVEVVPVVAPLTPDNPYGFNPPNPNPDVPAPSFTADCCLPRDFPPPPFEVVPPEAAAAAAAALSAAVGSSPAAAIMAARLWASMPPPAPPPSPPSPARFEKRFILFKFPNPPRPASPGMPAPNGISSGAAVCSASHLLTFASCALPYWPSFELSSAACFISANIASYALRCGELAGSDWMSFCCCFRNACCSTWAAWAKSAFRLSLVDSAPPPPMPCRAACMLAAAAAALWPPLFDEEPPRPPLSWPFPGLPGTLVTVMVNGFCGGCWLTEDGALAGVTDTLGGICGFFIELPEKLPPGGVGSPNIVLCCSLAADRPSTISSSLRRFFSFPSGGSSIGTLTLFFFISFESISFSLPLPAAAAAATAADDDEDDEDMFALVMLMPLGSCDDFLFLPIEKSCTSLRSIGPLPMPPRPLLFLIISAMFTFGKL
uniref:Uncharacterized protein n=1 Tax=Anopheles atroparvus TaxID=41427 RepID=A0A182IN31_ANOAO